MTKRQDLRAKQGETFSFVHTHKSGGVAVDLTGYSARMSVREAWGYAQRAYFSTGSDAQGGSLTLGGAAGTITIAMTAAQSSALLDQLPSFSFPDEMRQIVKPVVEFIYDLEIVDGSDNVTRVLEGKFNVRRGVTE